VAFAADTHLHADFLSGAMQLAAVDGARVLASAAGGREFDHHGLHDGDEVDLGGLTLRALATPGHTAEHLSFELLDGRTLVGVFTGGSLIVGGAARTDLTGEAATEELARLQYRSLERLARLPDAAVVWPTHGSGSFCSARHGAERTSTIGREKGSNPLFAAPDEDTFVERLVSGLGRYPPYFLRLADANRRGRTLTDEPFVAPLDAAKVAALLEGGTLLIDVRPVRDFADGHIPGALSIPLRNQFATWLGWLLDPGTAFVVVRNPDQDVDEVAWQALKIGFAASSGELAGGMAWWPGPTTATPLVRPDQIGGTPVLDVRQLDEFDAGHIPGATHIELGDLPSRTAEVPTGPLVVVCRQGQRAMTAASILERFGNRVVRVSDASPQDWTTATGRSLACA
jgi:rhodanese-related sulfurtransferase/glyoxylase-like metal-dependent hydrolase (beta-lactamase superfamily II)